MAELVKRSQTIIVHTHGQQHGKDHHPKDHHYSPSVAQLQQRYDIGNESYREVGSSNQQQDGKYVIPVFQIQPIKLTLSLTPKPNTRKNKQTKTTTKQNKTLQHTHTYKNTHTHNQTPKRVC